jgi:predicted Zn-dependent protease
MAQYLNKTANYIQGNILIEKGDYTKEELLTLNNECIEVISFSSLLVNYNTLTWSSEIKLGRLYKDGKAIAMIKGGIVSGNIKENLAHFRLSSELEKRASQGYLGPKYMLINSGVKIAGEES